MDMPGKYTLGTARWTVTKKMAELMDDKIGRCWGHLHEIALAADCSEDVEPEVFLHEVIHSIWYAYGLRPPHVEEDDLESVEEYVVNSLTLPLLEFMRNNPDVMEYLLENDES